MLLLVSSFPLYCTSHLFVAVGYYCTNLEYTPACLGPMPWIFCSNGNISISEKHALAVCVTLFFLHYDFLPGLVLLSSPDTW
jgi:uncharacterized membrane protein YGL010W